MTSRRTEKVVMLATLTALVMIAQQIGGKAVRDALFLSHFDVTRLPIMLAAAAICSILVVLASARAMAAWGPARVIPPAFMVSGLLQLLEWSLSFHFPRVVTVVLYLHIAALGSVLVSGFWSMYNERLDPRTAKHFIGKVAGGATLGAVVGGVVAERMAVYFSVSSMLPVLALLHLLAAWSVRGLAPEKKPSSSGKKTLRSQRPSTRTRSGLRILREVSYLRNLALLILMGTVAAALVDYVFKSHAVEFFPSGAELQRFFAVFYTILGVATFLVQTVLSARSLEKFGLANTAAGLPLGTALGSLAALTVPGLGSVIFARASEAVLRSSLFRSGYELFFTPIAEEDKRATKSIIDVGFERMGDALGAGIVLLVINIVAVETPVLLGLALVFSIAGFGLTRILHRGYVRALERSLVSRAVELDMSMVGDKTTLQTLTSFDLRELDGLKIEDARSDSDPNIASPGSSSAAPPTELLEDLDDVVRDVVRLRSGSRREVVKVLDRNEMLDPLLASHVIPLLAWDEISERSVEVLQNIAPSITGQLIDSLVDKNQEFAIRRRLPRVLAYSPTQRAADGLMEALDDRRFEVRFQAGRALSFISKRNPKIEIDESRVYAVVAREVEVDKRIWESHRLLDAGDPDEDDSPFVSSYLKQRSSRSLEHVFTMLSLNLPSEPLKIAFRGLQTQDPKLRGTALEYLESVLPTNIRDNLWPFLEEPSVEVAPEKRSRSQILDDLLKSNQSIELSLSEIRKRMGKA